MSPQVIAKRYAQALFELALRRNEIEEVAQDVQNILSLYQESRLFRLLLESPIYRGQQKIQWLRPVLEERLFPMLWTFIQLVIRRGREHLLNETCQAFLEKYDQYKRRVRVRLRAAKPLSETLRERFTEKIGRAYQAVEVVIEESVEPSLIGGFILEIGTRAADLSVQGYLSEIRKQLTQGKAI
ncbi:MAG: ATP synthase F1 subunit delta [Bacteroidia bacterium]|nr:ATP synthase F1 subunit delta [Bacteroidia bacterium]MDW8134010.1 ATP synthase F1 subunit delta [Bacteroidia bacterium]